MMSHAFIQVKIFSYKNMRLLVMEKRILNKYYISEKTNYFLINLKDKLIENNIRDGSVFINISFESENIERFRRINKEKSEENL